MIQGAPWENLLDESSHFCCERFLTEFQNFQNGSLSAQCSGTRCWNLELC